MEMSNMDKMAEFLKEQVKPSDEKIFKKLDRQHEFDMNLLESLNRFLVYSKKYMHDIAKEIGISHNTLNTFLQGSRGTNFRSKLKIKAYLDKELADLLKNRKK